MNHDVYSCLSAIPTGEAGERIVRGCLVLEGGAFRGLYTQKSTSPAPWAFPPGPWRG